MNSDGDDLAPFLEALSPDQDEAGDRYVHIQKKLIGFFNMRGVSDPAKAADEVIKRAGIRVRGGADVPDMERYCLGIARNVAKEEWRREQRESAGFVDFIQSLANDTAEEVERIESILKPCFELLEEDDRELLAAYCRIAEGLSAAEHRRRLAGKVGKTMRALRTHVSRLRDKLAACVETRLKSR